MTSSFALFPVAAFRFTRRGWRSRDGPHRRAITPVLFWQQDSHASTYTDSLSLSGVPHCITQCFFLYLCLRAHSVKRRYRRTTLGLQSRKYTYHTVTTKLLMKVLLTTAADARRSVYQCHHRRTHHHRPHYCCSSCKSDFGRALELRERVTRRGE